MYSISLSLKVPRNWTTLGWFPMSLKGYINEENILYARASNSFFASERENSDFNAFRATGVV